MFLHGIGGAKYDQVTDDIARRFFGFSLPEFATASATLRLPIVRPARQPRFASAKSAASSASSTYHPEQFLATNGSRGRARPSAKKLAGSQPPRQPQNARARHQAIAAANAALQPFVAPQRDALATPARTKSSIVSPIDSILNSREYSFCLFPREHFARLLERDSSFALTRSNEATRRHGCDSVIYR